MHAVDYRPLLVKYSTTAPPVRLDQVATVTDSVQTVARWGWPMASVRRLLIIFRQPGANIIDTVDGIKAAMPQLHASIDQRSI